MPNHGTAGWLSLGRTLSQGILGFVNPITQD
jgi:hypothetical protein